MGILFFFKVLLLSHKNNNTIPYYLQAQMKELERNMNMKITLNYSAIGM